MIKAYIDGKLHEKTAWVRRCAWAGVSVRKSQVIKRDGIYGKLFYWLKALPGLAVGRTFNVL